MTDEQAHGEVVGMGAVENGLAELETRARRLEAGLPDDIRAAGWMVGVHNDYIMEGRRHTFWLFTNNATGRFVKGESTTDAQALNWVRRMIGLPEVR
jgi:hypothetical protein